MSLSRPELYSDAALAQHRLRETRAEAEMWFLLACVARFAVPVPAGQEPSAYDGTTRPSVRVLALRAAIRTGIPMPWKRKARIPGQRQPSIAEQINNRGGRQ